MTDQTPAAPRLNRAQLAEQVAFYKALKEQANDLEKEFRDALTAQAADEWRREGSAPTWRVASLGTVSSAVTNDAIVVEDEDALREWVKARKPEEVETVERITATYRNTLLKNIKLDKETGALVNAAGDVVPGVKLVPGGQFKGISFLFSDDTKETYAQLAAEAVSRIALRAEPAGDAQPAATDGADDDALAAFAAFA